MTTRKHIVGNMTGAPELKFGKTGKAWATFTVASNDGKDDDKRTCYTRCKAFGELAENIAESLISGTRVIVEGREQTEEWETNGEKRSGNVTIVDAIGPDLRWATAKVSKNGSKPSTVAAASSGYAPVEADPWANDSETVPF